MLVYDCVQIALSQSFEHKARRSVERLDNWDSLLVAVFPDSSHDVITSFPSSKKIAPPYGRDETAAALSEIAHSCIVTSESPEEYKAPP